MNYPVTALHDQLEQALKSGALRPEARQWGQRLLSRLQSPVNVVVMGPPESGKSNIINMLSGIPAIPMDASTPVIEIAAGPKRSVVFEHEDGSIARFDGLLEEFSPPQNAIRAYQELPLRLLQDHSFIEINLTGGPAQKEAILEWAIDRADVILWCTQQFGADEQMIWSAVPDELKDHSFLVLTKADQKMMKGTLQGAIDRLEPVVNEEFLNLFPVATLQGIAASANDSTASDRLWKSSGGKALRDAVMHQVQSGRSADLDNAQVFLSRFVPKELTIAPPTGASPVAPVNQSVNQLTTVTQVQGAQNIAVFEDALSLLQTRAAKMLDLLVKGNEPDPALILESCVAAANALSDIMVRTGFGDASFDSLREDAMDSAEMMLLFQLEETEDAATDAVTLLLQLKNDIADRAVG